MADWTVDENSRDDGWIEDTFQEDDFNLKAMEDECESGMDYVPSNDVVTDGNGRVNQQCASADHALLTRIGVNTDKAGMEGLDKAKINQIIVEASKGSRYYKKELERERLLSIRIDKMLKQLKKFSKAELQRAEVECDEEMKLLESTRDLSRVIVHVDMDAFYAAVEMRDNPSLRDVPMAVGGASMLSTSNYLARRYGVRAAMPGFIAKKLCPDLLIVKSNFEKYRKVGEEVREVLAEYDPDFCPMGLDEAYLDITEYVNERITMREDDSGSVAVSPSRDNLPTETNSHEQTAESYCTFTEKYIKQIQDVVHEMRDKIHVKTSLTASAGIAPNRMLAKICSNLNKPNGQYYLDNNSITEFINTLQIRKVNGIGKVTEKMLNALGIEQCSDIYQKRGILKLLFSETSCQSFFRIALGLGSTQVNNDWERKSISTERTFSDTSSREVLYQKCSDLCRSLTDEVHEEELKGRTVTLKLKTSSFEVRQKSQTVSNPIGTYEEIHSIAKKLLTSEMKACQPLELRLMGVRLSNIERPCVTPPKKRPQTNTLDRYFHSSNTTICSTSSKREKQDICSQAPIEHPSPPPLSTEMVCPMCSMPLPSDNVQVNQHIDECLNLITINRIT